MRRAVSTIAVTAGCVGVVALVLAIRWERARSPLRSTVAVAVGTVTKLFPIVVFPLALIRMRRDRWAVAAQIAIFGGLLAAFYTPGALAPFSTLESITRYSLHVAANFDSVWGFAWALVAGFGLPAETIITTITLGGFFVTYVVFVVPQAWSARDPIPAAASAVLVLLIWSRLYSPQFSLWVLPFFALARLPLRAFVLLTLADIGVFLTVYPLTLANDMPEVVRAALFGGLAAAVLLRHAALILTARHAARRNRPLAS